MLGKILKSHVSRGRKTKRLGTGRREYVSKKVTEGERQNQKRAVWKALSFLSLLNATNRKTNSILSFFFQVLRFQKTFKALVFIPPIKCNSIPTTHASYFIHL